MTKKKRKSLLVLAVFTTTVFMMGNIGLGSVNAAVAPPGGTAGDRNLRDARQATATFHDLEAARDAGYAAVVADLSGATCIDEPGVGAMGIHYLNPGLLNAAVDAAEPEVAVYEPRGDGSLRLVALEYLTIKADWEAAGNTEAPALFGQTFDLVEAPNRFGIPDFYALHAWVWRHNPSGIFAMWNPKVNCP
jgi:hypothetical protein